MMPSFDRGYLEPSLAFWSDRISPLDVPKLPRIDLQLEAARAADYNSIEFQFVEPLSIDLRIVPRLRPFRLTTEPAHRLPSAIAHGTDSFNAVSDHRQPFVLLSKSFSMNLCYGRLSANLTSLVNSGSSMTPVLNNSAIVAPKNCTVDT